MDGPNQAEFGKMGGEIRSKNRIIAGVFHALTFIAGTIKPTIVWLSVNIEKKARKLFFKT